MFEASSNKSIYHELMFSHKTFSLYHVCVIKYLRNNYQYDITIYNQCETFKNHETSIRTLRNNIIFKYEI